METIIQTQTEPLFLNLSERAQSRIVDFVQGEKITTVDELRIAFEGVSQSVYSELRTGGIEFMEEQIEPVFRAHLRNLINGKEI